MRLRIVSNILALLVLLVGVVQLVPLGVSLLYNESDFYPFLFSCLVAFAAGGLMRYIVRHFCKQERRVELRPREGFAIVGLGWLLISAFGALPFYFAETFLTAELVANYSNVGLMVRGATDALFETISGFTTTGASVLTDFDQPHGIMFWRSMTHWIGGMGIILFSIAILPLLGAGGMQLFKAEVPGPVKDRLTPRIADTAKILWSVYLVLTVLETLLLHFVGKMSVYDALCHTFGTMATAGFSTYATSMIHVSPTVQYIVMVFMLLAGMNFALHFRAFYRRDFPRSLSTYASDPECRFYLVVVAIALVFVCFGQLLQGAWHGEKTLRAAMFQVVSIVTTTGYVSVDYALWHPVSHLVLFWLMFCGGCAGSTGGGVKMVRVLLAIKAAFRELRRLAQPRAVVVVRLGGKTVPEQVLSGVGFFLLTYVLLFSVSSVLLALGPYDYATAMTASVATMANIGPGLGMVGPVENFAHFAEWQKWLMCVNMLMGRLELYAILILFVPGFWKK